MRLIHYSAKPLMEVYDAPHDSRPCGAYKTPGLWVSVEGPDDWLEWCKGNDYGLETNFAHAAEIELVGDHDVMILSGAIAIDDFTRQFCRQIWDAEAIARIMPIDPPDTLTRAEKERLSLSSASPP